MYTILFVVTVFAGWSQVDVSAQQLGSFESREVCAAVANPLNRTVTVKDFGKSNWPIIKSQRAECVYSGAK